MHQYGRRADRLGSDLQKRHWQSLDMIQALAVLGHEQHGHDPAVCTCSKERQQHPVLH